MSPRLVEASVPETMPLPDVSAGVGFGSVMFCGEQALAGPAHPGTLTGSQVFTWLDCSSGPHHVTECWLTPHPGAVSAVKSVHSHLSHTEQVQHGLG